eukprot:TRINITY_DN20888_c2_g1_i1.p2 TRINITY_DN20888_c2_g1~~TRINITY_DN20888_c2_g1_i1.p2  ORF type:complete len:115 (-),score=14.85 TRINITY_DN20888_c2_g1_i1:65-409(-)
MVAAVVAVVAVVVVNAIVVAVAVVAVVVTVVPVIVADVVEEVMVSVVVVVTVLVTPTQALEEYPTSSGHVLLHGWHRYCQFRFFLRHFFRLLQQGSSLPLHHGSPPFPMHDSAA